MSEGRYNPILALVVALTIVGGAALLSRASETDQYTLPPQPLVDTGPELERLVQRDLQRVVDRTNAGFADLIERAAAARSNSERDRLLARAGDLMTADSVADAVFDELGRDDGKGLLKEMLDYRPSSGGLTSFGPGLERSIYAGTPFNAPLKIVPMLPTLRAHGVYFGGDKFGHFFQQGHEYYRAYRNARSKGATPARAAARAVDIGTGQEKTIFGEWVDGVYSNADLAVNYAGLQFYLNLTRPVSINGVQRLPLLVVRDERWQLNPDAGTQPVRPFLTDHWDESLNPCRYGWTIRANVRKHVSARARAWAAYRNLTRQDARALRSLQTWFGADYGHESAGALTPLPDTWFDD
jgi:hypothetical protein